MSALRRIEVDHWDAMWSEQMNNPFAIDFLVNDKNIHFLEQVSCVLSSVLPRNGSSKKL